MGHVIMIIWLKYFNLVFKKIWEYYTFFYMQYSNDIEITAMTTIEDNV